MVKYCGIRCGREAVLSKCRSTPGTGRTCPLATPDGRRNKPRLPAAPKPPDLVPDGKILTFPAACATMKAEGGAAMYPLEHKSVGFRFSSDLSLLTLKGAGLQLVESHTYCWDNRERRDEHCLVQFCLDGQGALLLDGICYPVRPGEAFLVDIPGKSRYFLPDDSDRWEFFFFEFSKECLPLLRRIYGHTGPVVAVGLDSPLARQMDALYTRALQDQFATLYENSRLAYGFWMDLTACALSAARDSLSRVDAAKAFMDQNYARQDLNLDRIADHAGLSKYYLCKEFQRRFGTTPGRYLREIRLAKACSLLMTNTDYTMEGIANRVGYSSNNYFGKVFRAEKGMPPDQYKRQNARYDLVRSVYETPKIRQE